jgi:hypothetical protein
MLKAPKMTRDRAENADTYEKKNDMEGGAALSYRDQKLPQRPISNQHGQRGQHEGEYGHLRLDSLGYHMSFNTPSV